MKKVTFINPFIHQNANLKKNKFLDRISNVQYLRASYLERRFLPRENTEWEILEAIHEAIHKGIFSFGGNYKIFIFEISKDFYDWFKNNELQTIQKQVINWIAAVYLSNPKLQDYFDDYIYFPVLSEVKRVIQNHYSESFSENYRKLFYGENNRIVESDSDHGNTNICNSFVSNGELDSNKFHEYFKPLMSEYNNASISYINCLPPKFLKNPVSNTRNVRFVSNEIVSVPKIKLRIGYLSETDWLLIVERDLHKLKDKHKESLDRNLIKVKDIERLIEDAKTDSLQRQESDEELFNNWLYSYRNYEKTKDHIFRMFQDEKPIGLIYLIKQRNSTLYKIGWTEKKTGMNEKQSIDGRIASLQTGNPHPLDIVGFFNASGHRTERTLHSYFIDKRLTGEWFRLNDKDVQNILSDDWRIDKNIF